MRQFIFILDAIDILCSVYSNFCSKNMISLDRNIFLPQNKLSIKNQLCRKIKKNRRIRRGNMLK